MKQKIKELKIKKLRNKILALKSQNDSGTNSKTGIETSGNFSSVDNITNQLISSKLNFVKKDTKGTCYTCIRISNKFKIVARLVSE